MAFSSCRLLKVIVCLAMIFCLLFSLCVPSHAAVGVDDAIIAGLIAALGSMGMDFFAQGLDRSGVVDEVTKWAEDNIGELPNSVQLALAAPNVLTIGGALWNYAVQCAQWFKSKFPSGSGTDNIVVPVLSSKVDVFTPGQSIYNPGGNITSDYTVYSLKCACTPSQYSGNTYSVLIYYLYVANTGGSQWSYYNRFGTSYYASKSVVSSGVRVYYFAAYETQFFSREQAFAFAGGLYPIDHLSGTTAPDSKLGAIVSDFADSNFEVPVLSDSSLDLVGTDVGSPETVPDNKNMFLGLPSSFGSLPEFVNRVFDGVDSDSDAGPLQSDYSSQLSDLIDVNGGILSNTNSIAQGVTGILSGVQALVADLVGFIGELPGYIGSLTGKFLSIWHYVVDWVNSLRPFLNSMLSVWSNLPAAMVLPVYASAVIVIVLGLYKRFFM